MPSKNTIKIFVKNGIYHIYNRGVEKRDIFLDKQDYNIFLYYLKTYLTAPIDQKKLPLNISRLGSIFDLHKNIDLICYVLMPNHFHFLIQQKSEYTITEFMRRLSNAYVKYFNEKYERVGPLFQGRYKAVLLAGGTVPYLSFYIHTNPIDLPDYSKIKDLKNYIYSSYRDYIDKQNTSWIFRDYILDYFQENNKFISYKKQTEQFAFLSDKYKKEKYENLIPFLLDY